MIKHIVMWKLKEENKEANIELMKSKLESLPAKLSVIKDFEVGVDFDKSARAFDVVLVSSFESKEALEEYKVNPDHVEVAQFIGSVVEAGKVVDYEI
jgi:hypothetical protein